jgi:adenylate kinase family enzyme
MSPQTFVFIGRSGCGKGTQAKLLDDYLRLKDTDNPIYHLETGQAFRAFIAENGYTNNLAKDIMLSGHRQPDFLAVWMWSHHFVKDLKGPEHLIIDGTPRSLNEAKILEGAFSFYGRGAVHIIYINVSRKWSEKHLLARGRADDMTDDIKHRLDWYENDVVPAVEYMRGHDAFTFVEVNGEQDIEKVHEEILQKIKE